MVYAQPTAARYRLGQYDALVGSARSAGGHATVPHRYATGSRWASAQQAVYGDKPRQAIANGCAQTSEDRVFDTSAGVVDPIVVMQQTISRTSTLGQAFNIKTIGNHIMTSHTRCPLCANTTVTEIETIAYERIWSGLSMDYGAILDQDVIHRHTPAEVVALVECRGCGLQYFTPAMPGDADFYRQLMTTANTYYSEEKWDFQAALEWVTPGDEMLDIACGTGAWLQKARALGRVVFAPSLYTLYRHVGLLDQWRLWRMSMMAVFETST